MYAACSTNQAGEIVPWAVQRLSRHCNKLEAQIHQRGPIWPTQLDSGQIEFFVGMAHVAHKIWETLILGPLTIGPLSLISLNYQTSSSLRNE